MKKTPPLGISLLCSIYIVNVAFFLLSLLLFYNRVLILGKEAGSLVSEIIKLTLIFVPLYLFFSLKHLKKNAWLLALCFHAVFIINNCSAFLEYKGYTHSLFRIAGIYSSTIYSPSEILLVGLHTLINLYIALYLFSIKGVFFAQKKRSFKNVKSRS
jgi:hypothetical protein